MTLQPHPLPAHTPSRRRASATWAARLFSVATLLLAACGGGSGSDGGGGTPVQPVADTARAQSASIGPEGGKVSTTTAAGVPITLFVPPNALASTQTITLTPVTHMGRAPLARGLVVAVQMEPSGLVFARPALLRFGAVAQAPAGQGVVAFGTANDGSRFQFNLAQTVGGGDQAATEMSINHFSDAGLAMGTLEEITAAAAAAAAAAPGEVSAARFREIFFALVTEKNTEPKMADLLAVWFDAVVKPALDAAASGTLQDLVVADGQWGLWIDARLRVQNLGSTFPFDTLLAPQDALARPVIARAMLAEIDDAIATCQRLPSLRTLAIAAYEQGRAKLYHFDLPELGLDTASFLRKINDCARPVLDPIRLPATLTAGTPLSMDARAQVVFASLPNPQGAPFVFTVTPTNAALRNAQANSDAEGRFTTVVTPSAASILLDVKACLVLTDLDPLLPTDICVTQQATNVAPDGILRGTVTLSAQTSSSSTIVDTTLGSGGRSSRVTVDATAQVEVNLRTGASRIVSKSAHFSALDTVDQFGATLEGAPGCTTHLHTTGSTSSSGSSFAVTAGDRGSIGFNGNVYTLRVLDVTGPTRAQGFVRQKFETLAGDCPPFAGERDDLIDRNVPDTSYLPAGLAIEGSGTVQVGADGSISVAGSRSVDLPSSSPGSTGRAGYTLSWNLLGRP